MIELIVILLITESLVVGVHINVLFDTCIKWLIGDEDYRRYTPWEPIDVVIRLFNFIPVINILMLKLCLVDIKYMREQDSLEGGNK